MQIKPSKKSVIDRIINLDKALKDINKPNLIMITKDKYKGYKITEHYYNINKQPRFKELFYDDYKDYLASFKQDLKIPIIINDLPITD